MVSAELYWFWNALMCACTLPLGGRLAGIGAPRMKPLLVASGLDGLLSLMGLRWPALAPVALLGLPGAVFACFRTCGWQACVRCTLTTLLAGLLCGGAVTACLEHRVSPAASGIVAAGVQLSACLLIRLMPKVFANVRQVELRVGERHIILPAMVDTGNLLRDPVTGLPVLVIPLRAARTLYPALEDPSQLEKLPLGFRLLNVRTAAGAALLPMFHPDLCRIYVNGKACDAELLVAVAGREYGGAQALVPLSAIPFGALSP